MQDFTGAYGQLKTAIVAIAAKFEPQQTDFPTVIGTGFFVSDDGLVCTCRHVVDAFGKLLRPAGWQGYPAEVLIFVESEYEGRPAWGWFPVAIVSHGGATLIGNPEGYVGPNPPDIAFLLIEAVGTPAVRFAETPLREGEVLGFSGFPMGTQLLKAPGWLHQVVPTLHWGMCSALLPHALYEVPHAFLMQSQTQGGASGSPVFRSDGSVVGMVYMGIKEDYVYFQPGGGAVSYQVPTSLTGCIPREPIEKVLEEARSRTAAFTGRKTLAQIMSEATRDVAEPGKGILEPYRPE